MRPLILTNGFPRFAKVTLALCAAQFTGEAVTTLQVRAHTPPKNVMLSQPLCRGTVIS